MYTELHCHSNFSFQDGASTLDELVARAMELGYRAMALTDHDNLCAAMQFARLTKSLDFKGIIGVEVTVRHSSEGWPGGDKCGPRTETPGGGHCEERSDEAISRISSGRSQAGTPVPPPPPGMACHAPTSGGLLRYARNDSGGFACPPPGQPSTGMLNPPYTFYHLTLLAETPRGYRNLCRLISYAHLQSERRNPELDPGLLKEHAEGLILLTGCRQGKLARLVDEGRREEARSLACLYREWFGPEHVYIELQQNLMHGDTKRNRRLVELAHDLGLPVVATGNVHYHVRERYQLHDALTAIKLCRTLEETHRERRANSEFYLKSPAEMAVLFNDCPEALANTLKIAERCQFDLTRDLDYRFPDYPVPEGHTPESYLEYLCHEAAIRRYGSVTTKVKARLDEEFRLIRKHKLAGFLLIYHDIIQLAREVMIDLGLSDASVPLEDNPPGRGRGSSVSMLVGYLIGLSHIDPLRYNLSLERFLPEDMANVPDIDLDFPRNIREELILRVHKKWGWERAALSGMLDTYKIRGAVRDLGKVLGLPEEDLDRLAKAVDHAGADEVAGEMTAFPEFKDKVEAPVWRDLVRLAAQLDGFPKYLAQHPGGMIIGSTPLADIVPIQPGAIDGRYICQWDKDSIDDAGMVKIDFLALGALSQIQEALQLIEKRTGQRIDLSRINFEDEKVYDMLCRADTIGIFQVESAAQIQTIPRIRPRNLVDMAHEVGAVRPGVGVNHGVSQYISRRMGLSPVVFDHPLEKRALERTLGIILFQDQVNQVAIDVAGFGGGEADQLRRAFGRHNNEKLIRNYWEKFCRGALAKGVPEKAAKKIFEKFNGQYMFPESHAFAFGVTAYQASWLKYYYPLEFYVGLFNQQPMGFYNLETLKEDARRHGVRVLNPDINRSIDKCTMEVIPGGMGQEHGSGRDRVGSRNPHAHPHSIALNPPYPGSRFSSPGLRLGFEIVLGVGEAVAKAVVEARQRGCPFRSLADAMQRSGILQEPLENLIDAGAFDCFGSDRRALKWECGLRYRPVTSQLPLPLPVEQDMAGLDPLTDWEAMKGEYASLGLFPAGHVMQKLRPSLDKRLITSRDMLYCDEGEEVKTAGLVVRRQYPLAKAYFITLEDEFGHISLVIWPQVYERYRNKFKEPFLIVKGKISRRGGTLNVVVEQVGTRPLMEATPKSKDWR